MGTDEKEQVIREINELKIIRITSVTRATGEHKKQISKVLNFNDLIHIITTYDCKIDRYENKTSKLGSIQIEYEDTGVNIVAIVGVLYKC